MAQNLLQRAGMWLAQQIAGYIAPEQVEEFKRNRNYYAGKQVKQLKTKSGQYDDNLTTNLVRLAVDRSTSMLFGGGVDFSVPEGNESDKQLYLDDVWAANKKSILLHRASVDGELFGTVYFKIVPDGMEYNGVLFPRIILLDSTLMSIEPDEMDIEYIRRYIFEMKLSDNDVFREVTRRANDGEQLPDGTVVISAGDAWVVEKYRSDRGGNWQLIGEPTVWAYPFPPIIHIQNLQSVHSVYGIPGVDGLLSLQDKYNFTVSNLLKIVRYHAHPKTWGAGIPPNAGLEKISWGADEMIKISDPNGRIANLEMQSDLASSRNIAQDLRQALFDSSRTVDISSIADKVGSLTNFGLRVLYSDALAKNSTRRELYGEGLKELNRRLLILNEMDGENSIVWGPDLPLDEKDDAELILNDLRAGIVSMETASEKRGYTWKSTVNQAGIRVDGEEAKIAAEKQTQGNIENQALVNLFAGRQVP